MTFVRPAYVEMPVRPMQAFLVGDLGGSAPSGFRGCKLPDDPILFVEAEKLFKELQVMSRHRSYQDRGFFSLWEVKRACGRVIKASRYPHKLDPWSLIRVLVTRTDIDEIPTKFYERTKFKLHDDEMDIRRAGDILREKSRGADFLRSVEALQEALESVWESSSVYLYDEKSNRMRLVKMTAAAGKSFSPYQQDWTEPQGLYQEALKKAREGEDVCIWDISRALQNNAAWVNPRAAERDAQFFYLEEGNPGTVATLVFKKDGKIIAIANVSRRVLKQEKIDSRIVRYPGLSYRPPLNEKSFDAAVRTLKEEIIAPAAKQIVEAMEGQSITELTDGCRRELSIQRLSFMRESGGPQYLAGVRPVRIKRSAFDREARVLLEIIKDPGLALQHIKNQVIVDLLEMFELAWIPVVTASRETIDRERMEKYLEEKCLASADKLIVVRDEKTGENLGFATLTEEYIDGKPFYALGLTSLAPSLQDMRLSVVINKLLIAEAWRENKHKFKDGRIPLVVRTATPKLLGALVEGLEEVWPNPFATEGQGPAPLFAATAEAISKKWSRGTTFNPQTFVSYGALKETFGFTFIPEKIQWHRHERVNDFCKKHLGNPEEGNAFMIMGYVSGAALRRSVWRDLKYRIGQKFIKVRNSIVRMVN